jgi:hypothetical protein
MILDGLEGDPSAGCDAAGWFFANGHGKFSWQAGKISLLGQYPCNQPIKEQ